MTIVMITGGIDISVGSFVAMGCMMLAWMMEKGGIGAVPAVLIVLVTGIVFGLVQGFLVAYWISSHLLLPWRVCFLPAA